MNVNIENFCGVVAAQFPLEGITLIAGDNAAGKSSIAKAVGAALSGSVVPVPGVLKNMAGMLVHSGAAKGAVLITTPDGEAGIEWPRATLKTKGTPPAASVTACGLDSLVTGTARERAAMLVELLQAVPTRDDLAAHLKPHGVNDETVTNLWSVIDRNGWDAAHNQAKETGARLKGQWEVTAGDRYGSKKAEAFTPNEWEPELAGASEDALKGAVSDARDALDGMIAISAVDDSEQARLTELAELKDARNAELEAAEDELKEANDKLALAKSTLAQLANPNIAPVTASCPHCKKAVRVASATTLEVPRAFEPADVEAYNNLLSKINVIESEALVIRAAHLEKQVALRESIQAVNALANSKLGNATHQQVDAARNALALSERRLKAYTTKTKADRINASIAQNINIVAALDMAGVRQQKLAGSVAAFLGNEVNTLAATAGWQSVSIDGDTAITYGERAWSLLSESEKYRVRVLLQVAIAIRDKSAAVVIDAADILGKAGRNGLIKLLRAANIPALVCMTINTVADVPDLRALRCGASYWLHDSRLHTLESKRA